MESQASLKFLKISPKKVRLVIDAVRGLDAINAEHQLKFMQKGAAKPISKLLHSAIANAENNFGMEKSNLYIKTITANDGPTLKRFTPRAFGRASSIRKRSSHINIVLAEKVPTTLKEKKQVAVPAPIQLGKEQKIKETDKTKDVNDEVKSNGNEKGFAPEAHDPRMEGKHRHQEHTDKSKMKKKGSFIKKVMPNSKKEG